VHQICVWTSLQVVLKHILIGLSSFTGGISCSKINLYDISILESYPSLKLINWCTDSNWLISNSVLIIPSKWSKTVHHTTFYWTLLENIILGFDQETLNIKFNQNLYIKLFETYTYTWVDRLCGLVVRVLDYRYRGPGFDSRALQQKKGSGSGMGSTQPRVQLRSYLIEKKRLLSRKSKIRP
jgi:hypothetical protein